MAGALWNKLHLTLYFRDKTVFYFEGFKPIHSLYIMSGTNIQLKITNSNLKLAISQWSGVLINDGTRRLHLNILKGLRLLISFPSSALIWKGSMCESDMMDGCFFFHKSSSVMSVRMKERRKGFKEEEATVDYWEAPYNCMTLH